MLRTKLSNASLYFIEGEDCEIQFGESVLLPAAQVYRRDQPDYNPNYDDPDDDSLQFYIALDVSTRTHTRARTQKTIQKLNGYNYYNNFYIIFEYL